MTGHEAACDLAVRMALHRVGWRLVRAHRSRWRDLPADGLGVAHTVWPADDVIVDKALDQAWDLLGPVLADHGGAPPGLVPALDGYVRRLIAMGEVHTWPTLARWLDGEA